MTLSIQTNQLKTRKHVNIDGHPYTVRKLGNIEQLDLSQYMRRVSKLAELEKTSKLTDAQEREIINITNTMSNMMVSLFDDGGDQSKSRALIASLSDEEIITLIEQIFSDKSSDDEAN